MNVLAKTDVINTKVYDKKKKKYYKVFVLFSTKKYKTGQCVTEIKLELKISIRIVLILI